MKNEYLPVDTDPREIADLGLVPMLECQSPFDPTALGDPDEQDDVDARWQVTLRDVARGEMAPRPWAPMTMEQIVAHERTRAPGDLTPSAWRQVCRAFQGRCAYCGDRVWPLIIEHFWPVSRGGLTSRNNILPACVPCNSTKSDREPLDWLLSTGRWAGFLARYRAAARRYE